MSMERVAKASEEYVNDILAARQRLGTEKISTATKQARLDSIMAGDKNRAMQRLGQSLIGPIQLKLRYQGITRNVLLEDPLTPGVPVEYDVLDDLGRAYFLHGTEGEVAITMFEGKRVPIRLFRLATFPSVKKEDLYTLRVNQVEYAQDESKQAIMRQEDSRLVTLIEAGITAANALPTPTTQVTPTHTVTYTTDFMTPGDLYTAATITDQYELPASRLLFNLIQYRDLYRFDLNATGWAFKDRVVAGERITEFGEFTIGKSPIIPANTTYLTPDPQFLGVMPVMYSLDVQQNDQVAQFRHGWVMDELIGMALLNPRGLVKLVKS